MFFFMGWKWWQHRHVGVQMTMWDVVPVFMFQWINLLPWNYQNFICKLAMMLNVGIKHFGPPIICLATAYVVLKLTRVGGLRWLSRFLEGDNIDVVAVSTFLLTTTKKNELVKNLKHYWTIHFDGLLFSTSPEDACLLADTFVTNSLQIVVTIFSLIFKKKVKKKKT